MAASGSSSHVVAADAGLAGGGGDEAGEHAHGGGLAGAVGPEEPQHFAGLDLEAHVVHRRERVVTFVGAPSLS